MKLACLIGSAVLVLVAAGADSALVTNGGFERVVDGKTEGWREVGSHYVYRDGEGRSGTRALCFENSDPQFYTFPMQKLSLKAGHVYEYEVWVRTENLVGDESGASLCIEWDGPDGRWMGGSYLAGVKMKGTKDWTRLAGVTEPIPAGAVNCRICPYVRKGMTGKAWFDDVVVRERRPEPLKGLYSSAYRNQAVEGEVRFHTLIGLPSDECGPDLSVRFTYQDAAGICRSVQATNSLINRVTIPVASLKLGEQLVKAALYKGERCLGEQTCRFTRLAQMPQRATWFDAYGRTIHQGRPFFPLGMYWGAVTTNLVETYAKGPFNCLMPYQAPNSRDLMDLCAEKGLKVIYSVKDVYYGTQWAPKGIETEADETRYIQDRVSRFKDHPALLAWYLNDELPITMKDRLTARRDLMEKLDPSHPGWVVLYQWTQIADYLPTFDVVGTDPYPIPAKPAAVATEWTQATVRGTLGCKPVWQVPQAFNWAAYRKTPEERAKCRAPTEAELRSMCWQCIARGANGLILYSFFDLYKQPNGEPVAKRWAECCRVGAEIREYFPILLSEPPPYRVVGGLGMGVPSKKWKGPKRPVSLRAWMKDGDVYVLFVNGYDEAMPVSTWVWDPSFTRATGVFGPTPKLIPSERNKQLAVELAPLEPALVRLSR